MTDSRQSWGATARNTEPILQVIERVLPQSGTVLEIASGTGQHAAHFAPVLPGIVWQTSEREPDHHESIRAWVDSVAVENLRHPVLLDVLERPWPVEIEPADPPISAIFNVNMIHIAPWAVGEALLDGAGRILSRGGVLFLYGPYIVDGKYRSAGDEAFDADLKGRNPEWGLRNLEDVIDAARSRNLTLDEQVDMPANNLSLVFHRT